IADDLEAGLSKRMGRQQILYSRNHRFHFVIAEQALHTTVGDDGIMIGQLERLLAVSSMPRVTFGIVPADTRYRAPIANMIFFDKRMRIVENATAASTITQPRELQISRKAFDTSAGHAV